MPKIHPTAFVEAGAKLADDVEVGPFCIVGPDVTIGAGSRLISHVNVVGRTTLGDRTVVYPFASLGTAPQWIGLADEPTELVIGNDNVIRESVSMNKGSVQGGGVTRVGNNNYFMVYAHVAHDCIVGNNNVFANSATLGGHVEVGDNVFLGGLAAIQQKTRIGSFAMLGGCSAITSDVIPFGMASGERAHMIGINMVGMKRQKFSTESIRAVRSTYRSLFFTGTLEGGVEKATEDYGDDPAARLILDFVNSRGARHLCQPGD
jgi:UDP-N-acetylglucosamine acyltransferase